MYDVFERLCKEKGVTAYKVAKATGISTATFSNWKAGRSVPKTDKLQLIANYFDVPIEVFTSKQNPVVFRIQRPKAPLFDARQTESLVNFINEEISKGVQEVIKKVFSEGAMGDEALRFDMEIVDRYHAADPGTQAAVRKLLDIPDSGLQDDDLLPIAAHAEEGATEKDLESDVAILREHTEK